MDDDRTKRRSDEEYAAAIRQARAQADSFRERALEHDRRMEEAMELLNRGWKGPKADALLRDIEDTHQSVRALYLAQAAELDAQSEDLQKEYRRSSEQNSEQEKEEE